MNVQLAFDVECNGLDPSEIFVLGITDIITGQHTSYTSEEDNIVDGLIRLTQADLLVAHYGLGFDIPVIERLTNGLIKIDRSKVVDTCALSMRLFPNLQNHKLRTWGDILGFPKGEHTDFTKFSWAMVDYCEIDCEVTVRAFKFMLEYMADADASTQRAA
jgi:DNA polymerase III alpha subunit (gram-positive type)